MTEFSWLLYGDTHIDYRIKAFGPNQQGRTVAELVGAETMLDDLPTPLLTLDAGAVEHNIAVMRAWTEQHGVDLAPHGKTTMAPALWRRQLDAGAWAITVATPWQLRVAATAGVRRIQHAGAIVDPNELAHIGHLLGGDPGLEILIWADSPRVVSLIAAGYPPQAPPLAVLVERGGPGARTGARTTAEAMQTALAVDTASNLTIAGVAAWEGSLQGASGPDGHALIAAFCDGVAEAFVAMESAALFPAGTTPVITGGGSAYFDIVAERWAFLSAGPQPRARVVLRSGCYLAHDDGGYAATSPFARPGNETLTAALHGWAQVVSRPEPQLALLNAGRRDLPFDGHLPVPKRVRGRDATGSARALLQAQVTALNDQHTFLALSPESDLDIGEVVQFGISHPCTAFDKWTVIPVLDDAHAAAPRMVGAVRTVF